MLMPFMTLFATSAVVSMQAIYFEIKSVRDYMKLIFGNETKLLELDLTKLNNFLPFTWIILDIEETTILNSTFPSMFWPFSGTAFDNCPPSNMFDLFIIHNSANSFQCFENRTTFQRPILIKFSVFSTWAIPTIPVQSKT